MIEIQTECSKSIIKFWVAEMCKPCEIQRICAVHEKACLSQKNVYKWVEHGNTSSNPGPDWLHFT